MGSSEDQLGLPEDEVFQAVGHDGFKRLVDAFYRQVPTDDILGPMYPPDDLVGAEERLRDFLIFRFGGPTAYLAKRGHPRLRIRHAPFRLNQAARDRWVQLMERALEDAQLPAESKDLLCAFFHHMATFLMNTPN